MSFNLTLNKEYAKEEIESIWYSFWLWNKRNQLEKFTDGRPYYFVLKATWSLHR